MQKTLRISKIAATCFRGATKPLTVDIDSDKGTVFIYGENGTGKSTIVDALDVVCNRSAGSILEISSTSISKHLPSLGSVPADVRVEVSAGGDKWTAQLKGQKILVSPDTNIPSASILRRSQILELVIAPPADRFQRLKSFIDVSGVEKSEATLDKAIKEMRKEIDRSTDVIRVEEDNIKNAFNEERTPEEESLSHEEWAKKRSKIDLTELKQSIGRLKGVLDQNKAALTIRGQADAGQTTLNEKRRDKEEVEKKIVALGEDDSESGVLLSHLLGQARQYLERNEDIKECPVCASTKTAEDIIAQIDKRLQEMKDLPALAKTLKAALEAIKSSESTLKTLYTTLVAKMKNIAEAVNVLDAKFRGEWTLDPEKYAHVIAWCGKLEKKEQIKEARTLLEAMTPLMERITATHDKLAKQEGQLSNIRRGYKALLKARKDAAESLKCKTHLEKMLPVVRKERLDYVQEILDLVADECDRLYGEIHENEGIGGVRFALDQEKRGSLHQTGTFGGQNDIVPQAYFSESHLDTLGFCFFLALAKHATQGKTCIVLDDVFTSVDLNHIERVLTLLLAESANYNQIIFTTHQRRWLTLLESGRVSRNMADIVELAAPWTMETGISSRNVTTLREQLEAVLQQAHTDRRGIGSTAGMLLELVLDELTKRLGCTIKRNPRDRYTCAPLLDAMRKPAKQLTITYATNGDPKVLTDETDLQGVIDTLRGRVDDGRNTVGVHFNWDACDITDADIRTFGEQTRALVNIFTCPDCGSMAIHDNSKGLLHAHVSVYAWQRSKD